MPHAGHRTPNAIWNVQGGNPNCWCVPKPLASGLRVADVTRSPSNTDPTAIKRIRWNLEILNSSEGIDRITTSAIRGGRIAGNVIRHKIYLQRSGMLILSTEL